MNCRGLEEVCLPGGVTYLSSQLWREEHFPEVVWEALSDINDQSHSVDWHIGDKLLVSISFSFWRFLLSFHLRPVSLSTH